MLPEENLFGTKLAAYITYDIIDISSTKKKRKMASWDESEGPTDKFRLMLRFTYFSCLILNWKMASLFLRCETSKMVFLSGYCMGMTKVEKMEECEEEVMV